jgi:predicted ATPase
MSSFVSPPIAADLAPKARYEARRDYFAALRDDFTQRGDRQGIVNVVLFFAALGSALLGVARGAGFFWLAGALFIGFILSFSYHSRLDAARRRYRELVLMQEEALARLRRDWAQMPLRPFPPAADETHLARDLDLTGHASLEHLLGTAQTPVGLATLQSWLLAPAEPAVVRARQAMIAELAALPDFRDELAVAGRLMGNTQRTFEDFATWAEKPPFIADRPGLLWATRILPLITLALLLAQLVGWLAAPLWLLGVGVNYGLTYFAGKGANEDVDGVAERHQVFEGYAAIFAILTRQRFTTPGLQQLQQRLMAGTLDASAQMRRLNRIMPLIELRRWAFFILIQVFTLALFQMSWLLDRWRSVAGPFVRDWLTALGECEALAALATLAHDHPAWAFPDLAEAGERTLVGQQVGHPLLAPEVCVGNDVALGPPGRLLLVTGSNMSGKSTLLRAIGVNVVLAQAGGPVCALALRVPSVQLATSIRVTDSLEQGVSYYLAELRQLKSVVDAAAALHQQHAAEGDGRGSHSRSLLFLLDEILHGTNTTERQIAARHIIRYLLDLGALGAVSTHDLTLAASPELLDVSDLVHFTESFAREHGTPVMRFDYQLRPGLATSTNALQLMEIVGLPALEATVEDHA